MLKHKTRTIDVWENQGAHCEREGNTLSLQVRTPKGVVAMVIPVEVVADLQDVLSQASAISPAGTTTMDISRNPVDGP